MTFTCDVKRFARCSSEMATHLKIVILPFLLMFMVLMEDVKPVLAKQGERLKQRTKKLEETVRELNEKMKEQDEKIKEQEEKMKEQEEKMKEQEEKMKEQEECKGKYTQHQF